MSEAMVSCDLPAESGILACRAHLESAPAMSTSQSVFLRVMLPILAELCAVPTMHRQFSWEACLMSVPNMQLAERVMNAAGQCGRTQAHCAGGHSHQPFIWHQTGPSSQTGQVSCGQWVLNKSVLHLQALTISSAARKTHTLVVRAAGENRPVMIGLAADSGMGSLAWHSTQAPPAVICSMHSPPGVSSGLVIVQGFGDPDEEIVLTVGAGAGCGKSTFMRRMIGVFGGSPHAPEGMFRPFLHPLDAEKTLPTQTMGSDHGHREARHAES